MSGSQELEKLLKDEKSEFYKLRNGGIKRVYEFLKGLKGVRDLHKTEGNGIRFYISEKYFTKFQDWNHKENNILKSCALKMTGENAEDGYYINILGE